MAEYNEIQSLRFRGKDFDKTYESFEDQTARQNPAGGYYTPIVDVTEDNVLEFAWEPSNANMPVIPPQGFPLPEQVQADLSQNDPTQPDYVKGRTHWEEGNQTVIEWDGNTEGLETFAAYNGYKVSDNTPVVDDIVGSIIRYGDGAEISVSESDIETQEGLICCIGEEKPWAVMTVVNLTDSSREEMAASGRNVPSNGIYFGSSNGDYIASLTYGSTTVHQLDEKFIPESIARVADIPTDEHINDLINTALGVIENGAY